MTSPQRLERDLPAILGDLSIAPYPDYIDDVLATTALRRQRPAWTVPERWLPMEISSQTVAPGLRSWRPVVLLVVLALLLVAIAAAYVGSQPRRTPAAPFGPAANGSIVFARDGDIFRADPVTGATTAIVGGPEADSRPVYSPDGTRIAFGRALAGDATSGVLFVADADGRGLVQVTPTPLRNLSGWSFSPDGRSVVAIASAGLGQEIVIAASDGSGAPKEYPTFATLDDGPAQYRADGSEIMFIGREAGMDRRGVYAIDPTTGTVRTIVAPLAAPRDIHGANWSPDGGHIAYGEYDPTAGPISARTHVVAADGTGDRLVDTDPRAVASSGLTWANDGTRLLIDRSYSDTDTRTVIVPVDGSSTGVEIGCPPAEITADCVVAWSWSPDDRQLLGTVDLDGGQSAQFFADPSTGAIRAAPFTGGSEPGWQRLAQ